MSKSKLIELGACRDGLEWAGDRTLAQIWAECERPDWMIWLARRLGVAHKLMGLCACACARTALQYVPPGEDRPRLAIEASEAYWRGEATIEQVRDARAAARAAAYAAYSADYPDYSAVYSAYAAYSAAAAAAAAARAAAYAAYSAYSADYPAYSAAYDADADCAAYAAAESAAHAACAAADAARAADAKIRMCSSIREIITLDALMKGGAK